MTVRLVIPGEPMGKGRPRVDRRRGHMYTPPETRDAEKRIQAEWMAVGRPELGPGPVMLKVELVVRRPQAHVRLNGSLGVQGERTPWPIRKPDVDNAVKLALDALNGLAFLDDQQVVSITAWRRWTRPAEPEHTLIELWPAPVPNLEEAA